MTSRKYYLNEKFFDTWSEPMAYILGFIIADGNICKNKCKITICIHKKDIALLNYIKLMIDTSYPIRYQRGYPYILISSVKMVTSLKKLGVMENKRITWNGFTYKVDDKYKPSIVRGFFDGGGWVSFKKNNQNQIRTGFANKSRRFLEQIRSWSPVVGGYLGKRPTWYQLDFGHSDSIKLRNFIYKPGGFSLIRKYNKIFSVE